jgi:hypothetical protein
MRAKAKNGVLDGVDRRAVAWGWAVAVFGIKMFWIPGSTVNLLVNCAGVRDHTPDVYSKIFFALIPTFNGWSSLICVAAGAALAALISKRLKAKQAMCVLGLAVASYALLVLLATFLRPLVH